MAERSRRRWWMGAAVVAVVAVGGACGPTPTTTPSFTAVAGTGEYHPYSAITPTTPVPASSVGMDVYAVSLSAPDKKSVVYGMYNQIVRYDRGAKTLARIAGGGSMFGNSPGLPIDDAIGGPATDAALFFVDDLATTPDGTTWFSCDACGTRLMTVSPTGTLGVGAGGGTDTGDGGPAATAALTSPDQIVVAPDGDLYFLDDTFVKRIDLPSGTIHTVYESSDGLGGGGGGNSIDLILHIDASGGVYLFSRYDKELLRVDSGTAQPIALSGASCIGQDVIFPMSGTAPGGSLAFVTGTWVEATNTWANPRECRIVPSTGVAKQLAVDPTLAAIYDSQAPAFRQISRHVVIGPDNIRWAVGWGAGGAPQLFRWVTG